MFSITWLPLSTTNPLQPAWQGEKYECWSSPHTGEYFTKSQSQCELHELVLIVLFWNKVVIHENPTKRVGVSLPVVISNDASFVIGATKQCVAKHSKNYYSANDTIPCGHRSSAGPILWYDYTGGKNTNSGEGQRHRSGYQTFQNEENTLYAWLALWCKNEAHLDTDADCQNCVSMYFGVNVQ